MSVKLVCLTVLAAMVLTYGEEARVCSDWSSHGKIPPKQCAGSDCPFYKEEKGERCYDTCNIIVARWSGKLKRLAVIRRKLIEKIDRYFSGKNKEKARLQPTEPTWQKIIPSSRNPRVGTVTIFRMIPFSAQNKPPEPFEGSKLYLRGPRKEGYCLYIHPVQRKGRGFLPGRFAAIKRMANKFKDNLVYSGDVEEEDLNMDRYYVLSYQNDEVVELGILKNTDRQEHLETRME